jgi:hypothetical protein
MRGKKVDDEGKSGSEESRFVLEGRAAFEEQERPPEGFSAVAYVFGAEGELLGQAPVDAQGNFAVPVRLRKPADVELVVGPEGDPREVREAVGFAERLGADRWVQEGERFRLRTELLVPKPIWWPWFPWTICITGHVRKVHAGGPAKPVPSAKVELFDVDREGCWWPYLIRWWDHIVDQPVVRLPELIEERPIIKWPPPPDPPDQIGQVSRFARGSLLPPALRTLAASALNPQPEPPGIGDVAVPPAQLGVGLEGASISTAIRPRAASRSVAGPTLDLATTLTRAALRQPDGESVGEIRDLPPEIAKRIANLTLTSLVPPWLIWPRCFYSQALVCETFTDCDGAFKCCFKWFPWHIRRGRLRFDSRPDIIVKVTQNIGGVETTIYLDPYTSTRWNVTNANIDLYLDNEQVLDGNGCGTPPPPGPQFWMERVGADEVYKINKNTGCYEFGGLTNVAYGDAPLGGVPTYGLALYATFGAALRDGNHFYRLTYARETTPGVTPPDSAFLPVDHPQLPTTISEYRRPAGALGVVPTLYNLGPKNLPGVVGSVYEIRDLAHDWLYSDDEFIGIWRTFLAEPNTGTYVLRLEIFDGAGTRLTGAAVTAVDNRGDGSGVPPTLVSMGDRYDLIITVDNGLVSLALGIPAAINACGVVPWGSAPSLVFNVAVSQPNGRLQDWALTCTKGTAATPVPLGAGSSGSSTTGSPSTVTTSVSGNPLLHSEPITPSNPTGELQSTCAFALVLDAHAHIRNGFYFFYYRAPIQAIAIEHCICPPCPPL